MATLLQIRTAVASRRAELIGAFTTFQDNQFAANGRFFQGIITHGTLPDDGIETPPTVGLNKPHYQAASWPAIIRNHPGLPMAIECHQYVTPSGVCGWVLFLRFTKAGRTWEWAEQSGPEGFRAHGWLDITPAIP